MPDPEMNRASRIFLSVWGYIGVIAMSQKNCSRDIRLTNLSMAREICLLHDAGSPFLDLSFFEY